MKIAKTILFLVCLLPVVGLVVGLFTQSLGANPVDTITRETGEWSLRLLLATLLITPLRQLTGKHQLIRFRRMLGVYAYFYVLLHFTTFWLLDHSLDISAMLEDIIKKNYILVGFLALLMLTPLAITSTNKMIKRLGGSRWRKLHWLVYPAAILGVVHFWWLVKSDITEPLIYATVLALLLGYRVFKKIKSARVVAVKAQAVTS